MNLREGRIGVREGISIAAIAMCTSGLFTFEHKKYLRLRQCGLYHAFLPAESLRSFFFIIVLAAMRRQRGKKLSDSSVRFGGTIGAAGHTCAVLCLLAAAYSPLSGFIQAMHGLFFNGIGYGKLAMYVLPTVLFVAWLGFETIGRTAKCFALLLLIVLAASILTASSEFETYRLYPFPGSNIGLLTRQAFSQSGAFLPALLSLLITCTGLRERSQRKKQESLPP